MELWVWIFGSVFLVSLLSLIGALTLFVQESRVRRILPFLVSFSAGALFGDAFIHLLPEAFELAESGIISDIEPALFVSLSVLAGILTFFVLEKIIHWHHCHTMEECDHLHAKPLGVTNLVGDALHNFVDGLLIAGSFIVSIPLGIATTIAVILHEIPQELSDFGVLLHAGFSRTQALAFNFASALAAVAGAVVIFLIRDIAPAFELFLVSLTVGGFIYIAGSDLIPELHRETNVFQNVLQFLFMILGMLFMLALVFLE